MKKAVIPGSYDPITNGHVDIILRASRLFDEVVVLVGTNIRKNYLFSIDERVEMIRDTFRDYPNIRVDAFSGLIVDYAKKHDCSYIVKGLRDGTDFTYEHEMEINNTFLSPSVETVYLSSRAEHLFVRSSSVREFVSFGTDVSSFVPSAVMEKLRLKGLQS